MLGGHDARSQILACGAAFRSGARRAALAAARQGDSCPWQVNSIGWVRGKGRNYVLAVLTTDDPAGPGTAGLDYGISTIQGVSQRIWASLAPRPAH